MTNQFGQTHRIPLSPLGSRDDVGDLVAFGPELDGPGAASFDGNDWNYAPVTLRRYGLIARSSMEVRGGLSANPVSPPFSAPNGRPFRINGSGI